MNVGILTFHRAHNYGAVLQCYALQEVLKQLGHNVDVIDYRQKWIESIYTSFSIYALVHRKGLRKKVSYIKNYNNRRKIVPNRKNHFEGFVTRNIKLSKLCNNRNNLPQNYDYYIIGSDQLWSTTCLGGRFDPIYWGDFLRNNHSKVIGYAISLDKSSIKEIVDRKLPVFENFSSLSLREVSAIDAFKEICNIPLHLAIDPTLLGNGLIWQKLINDQYKDRKYIALYQVRYPIKRNVLINKAKNLASRYGYELIDLSSAKYSVEDFVSIIKYARCVVTSSFHATVFSLIFGTPFYSYKLNDGKDGRYVDLLEQVGCLDRAVNIDFDPQDIIPLEKSVVDENLEKIRKSSLDYLTTSIQ